MGLSDLNFIFRFLPVFLLLYFLFGASIIFCGLGSLPGALVLLCSVTANYMLVSAMDQRRGSLPWHRGWLLAAVLFNLGLLCYFKYRMPALPPG